jgi:hypothetical protein
MQRSAMASGNAIDLPAKLIIVLHNVVLAANESQQVFCRDHLVE